MTILRDDWVLVPLRPGTKVPAVRWQDWTADNETVTSSHEAFEQYGDRYNWAILTGHSGVIVVDIDPKNFEGDAEAYKNSLLVDSPTDLVVKTPRGGWHLYYNVPSGVRVTNSPGAMPDGVDIRGYGGIAALPPSTVKYDGGFEGSYSFESDGEPGNMSATLLQTIMSKPSPERAEKVTDYQERSERLDGILRGELKPGKIHSQLLWASNSLAARGMPRDVTESLICRAYEDFNGGLSKRERKELLRIVGDAYGHSYKGDPAILGDDDIVAERPPSLEVMTYEQFAHTYQAEDRFWVDTWLPMNSIIMVVAAPETGKTWLLIDMAVSLSLGSDLNGGGFLGRFPTYNSKGINTLFIQQEDSFGRITSRFDGIMNARLEAAGNPFFVYHDGDVWAFPTIEDLPGQVYMFPAADLSFDQKDSFDRLEQTVVDHDIKVVFFDPLYTLGPSDNYFVEFKDYFQRLKQMREKLKVTFVFAHHQRKSGGDGRQAGYGSALLDAASEGAILLNKNGQIQTGMIPMNVRMSGKSFPRPTEMSGTLAISIDGFEHSMEFQGEEVDLSAFYDISPQYAYTIYCALDEDAMTESQIVDSLKIPRTSVHTILKKMYDADMLICENPEAQRGRRYRASGDF